MVSRAMRVVGLLCICASAAWAQMQPLTVQWTDANSPADVSFLLRAPAGKDGFIRINSGHLVYPDGSRLRIWGVNMTGKAGLPDKSHAPTIAARLAQLGINCVRFHFLDRPAPNGIIAANRNDTRALDPAQLDRLDLLIFELKKRGIYSDLNLNVARSYKAGDGVRDYELLGFAKALTHFDPRIIELQKEYAKQLLTHRNPYTGNEYRNEPAVAIVELVNENSLAEAWFTGRLIGKATARNPGTWTDIPASYASDLTDRYNAWLAARFSKAALAAMRAAAGVAEGEPLPRLRPDEFAKAPKDRFQAEAEFYITLEKNYVRDMAAYLRDELKVNQLLIANSDHGHGKTGYPQLAASSLLDVVDGHVYWQHPDYVRDPSGRQGFRIPNTPMVDDPLQSSVVQLSRSAFAGKPYTVSETNHPFPNEYACEGIPILAAYAALNDWDGIFLYSLAHDDVIALKPYVRGHFDLAMDPIRMAQIPAGALIFGRGDVRPAARTVERSLSPTEVYDSIRLSWKERPYFTPGFALSIPLKHGSRIKSLDAASAVSAGSSTEDSASPIRSDTGELTWRFGQNRSGLVSIDTDRTQALIGFCKSAEAKTKNLRPQLTTEFSAITLSSLDAQPIVRSGKLLLTACAKTENTDMRWNAQRTSLENWGTAPTRIEVVQGRINIVGLDRASAIQAQPLDGAGRPAGEPISLTPTDDEWILPLGSRVAVSWVITVRR